MFKKVIAIAFTIGLLFAPAAQAQAPSSSGSMLQFGGNGLDGAVTISTNTNPANYFYNAAGLTINTGITLTCRSGTVINSQRAVTINGNLVSAKEIVGGPSPGTRGGQFNGGYAGGGGGCAGFGGAGAGSSGAAGGTALPITASLTGSVGGTGAPSTSPGQGAGNIRVLSSGTVTVAATGQIDYSGLGGSSVNGASTTGGGGGGSGGVILLYSMTQVVNSGTITVQGGGGGSGTTNANGGGGGAGGFVVMMSPSAPTSGTVTLTGGGGGSAAGTGVAGTIGGTGTLISITDTPSYPLIAEFEKRLPMFGILAKLRGGKYVVESKESRSFLAAMKSAEEGTTFDTALNSLDGEQTEATVVEADGLRDAS